MKSPNTGNWNWLLMVKSIVISKFSAQVLFKVVISMLLLYLCAKLVLRQIHSGFSVDEEFPDLQMCNTKVTCSIIK